MRRTEAVEKLREAFAALREERTDGGAGLVFKDVWTRADVARATAYRDETGFKAEFDASIAALKGVADLARPDVPVAESLAQYRALVARLANQIQLLALELDRERRRSKSAPGTGSNVYAFPAGDGRQRPQG